MPRRPRTQASRRGLEREKQAAAAMKNTVVGRPGTTMPRPPRPTQAKPTANQPARNGTEFDVPWHAGMMFRYLFGSAIRRHQLGRFIARITDCVHLVFAHVFVGA